MNSFAYVLGGTIFQLIFSALALVLVRPKKLLTACAVTIATLLVVATMIAKGGGKNDSFFYAEISLAFVLTVVLYSVVKIILVSIAKNGLTSEMVEAQKRHALADARREKLIVYVCATICFTLIVYSLIAKYASGSTSTLGKVEEPKLLIQNGSDAKINSCYLLVNGNNIVKVGGELDGYITAHFEKNTVDGWLYFPKEYTEKQVKNFWNKNESKIFEICGASIQ